MVSVPQPIIPHPPCLTLAGVPSGAEPLVLAELLAGKLGKITKTIVHIAVNDRNMDMLAAGLGFFCARRRNSALSGMGLYAV